MSMNHETFKKCEHTSLSNENFCFNCGALKADNVRYKKLIFRSSPLSTISICTPLSSVPSQYLTT